MKLPEGVKNALRIKPEDRPGIPLTDILAEAIARDCAKAYEEWKKLDHFRVGDFPQYLQDRYGLEPK